MKSIAEMAAILREWPRGFMADVQPLVRESLGCACTIFEARRAILALEDGDEPELTLAVYDEGSFVWRQGESDRFLPLVAEELNDVVFYDDAGELARTATGDVRVHETIHPDLRDAFAMRSVLTFPVRGEVFQGRVFLIEPRFRSDDALAVAEVIQVLFESRLDAAAFCRSGARDAVSAERGRLARDLHDGLLQSFTGIVLQLETVHALLGEDAEAARRTLTEVQAAIMSDQRDLRAHVEDLRPRRRRGEMIFDFYSRLDEMRRRFGSQWGLRVALDTSELEPLVSQSLGQETFQIVQEAVTNSAKHGRAQSVEVKLRTHDGMLFIDVGDDGTGLPVRGRFTLADLREKGVGPSMLSERVASLNGDLTVDSSETGLKLSITIPLGWAGA